MADSSALLCKTDRNIEHSNSKIQKIEKSTENNAVIVTVTK